MAYYFVVNLKEKKYITINYNFNDSCIRNISNRFGSYATTGLEGHRKYLLLDYFGLFWPALNSDMGYAFPINASSTARFVKFMMQSRHCQDTLPNFYDFLYIFVRSYNLQKSVLSDFSSFIVYT